MRAGISTRLICNLTILLVADQIKAEDTNFNASYRTALRHNDLLLSAESLEDLLLREIADTMVGFQRPLFSTELELPLHTDGAINEWHGVRMRVVRSYDIVKDAEMLAFDMQYRKPTEE